MQVGGHPKKRKRSDCPGMGAGSEGVAAKIIWGQLWEGDTVIAKRL